MIVATRDQCWSLPPTHLCSCNIFMITFSPSLPPTCQIAMYFQYTTSILPPTPFRLIAMYSIYSHPYTQYIPTHMCNCNILLYLRCLPLTHQMFPCTRFQVSSSVKICICSFPPSQSEHIGNGRPRQGRVMLTSQLHLLSYKLSCV